MKPLHSMRNIYMLLLFITAAPGFAQVYATKEPLAHTFSVVARDSISGDLAIGVQSHWFNVGSVVPWAEAGVGIIATQSFINVSFGVRGLALLKQGKTPQQVLDELLKDDPGREVRQVAVMDKNGNVATFTGKNCVQSASHLNGNNFSVQANMMLNDKVVPTIASALKQNAGLPLPERLMAAMLAGQAAGGDIRGKQSAAIVVVKGKASNEPWTDKLLDLRVEDHAEPLKEMERILKTFRAYEHMNNGDLAMEKGEMPKALTEYTAAEKMFPDNLEMQYWHAITLANNGKTDEAIKMLRKIYKQDANWRTLTGRLPASGLLNVDASTLQKLTAP